MASAYPAESASVKPYSKAPVLTMDWCFLLFPSRKHFMGSKGSCCLHGCCHFMPGQTCIASLQKPSIRCPAGGIFFAPKNRFYLFIIYNVYRKYLCANCVENNKCDRYNILYKTECHYFRGLLTQDDQKARGKFGEKNQSC